jgi:hypothetical protein
VVQWTKRSGSWPGFDVEVLQDGADADDQCRAGNEAVRQVAEPSFHR